MNRLRITIVPIAIVQLAIAGCSEGTTPSTRVPSFADLDTDGSGSVSRRESARVPELADIFPLADADQDGQLSVAEFSMATIEGTTVSQEGAGGPLFTELDTDNNGLVTEQELGAVPQLREELSTFDIDRSGALNSHEYHAAMQQLLADRD